VETNIHIFTSSYCFICFDSTFLDDYACTKLITIIQFFDPLPF